MGPGLNADAPGGASPPIGAEWHGAGLTDLIDRLRQAGFRAGAAEAVSAGRLLARLAGRPNAPTTREALLAWLRPVFCNTREEQARFDPIFLDWAKRFGMAWRPTTAAPDPATAAAAGDARAAAPRRAGSRWLVWALALLLAGAVAVAWWWWPRRAGVEVAPPAVPASQVPGPAPAASAAPLAAAASAPDLLGLFPAVREARTLRADRVWPLLAVPLLLWLLAGGVPGLQLMQGRRRSGRRVVLDTRTLADEARQSLPALTPAVAGRLERHVRGDSDLGAPLARRRRLDARRTVEATLRNHGLLSPRYRLVPLRPSYLMLIDAHNEHDPRGRLFYLWAERMKREGLAVDIRLFRPGDLPGAAPECWQGGRATPGAGQRLDDLDDPPPGQRLVVISEAPAWLREDGRWHAWFERARLSRWPQRAFFTPAELRDWGPAEEAVERAEHAADPGFLTLPLDEAALDAWSVLLASGSLPAFSLAEPQRFPRLLAAPGFDAFSAPSPADLDKLIAQLKLYLGDSGFRWLAALAVPPLVRWELTLLLGRALFDHRAAAIGERWRDVLGRCYRRLARLPWLRGGTDRHGEHHGPALPGWLRLRLLDELPAEAQAEIRLVVDRLLSRLRPEAGGELALDLETPPGHGDAPGAKGGAGDALYLGYLSGLTPRQLALRLPGDWHEWLRRERLAEPGWRARSLRAAQAGREWAKARLARLAFRDGMPWSRRRAVPLAVAAAMLAAGAIGITVLVRTPASGLSPALDDLLFTHDTRAVALPDASRLRGVDLSPDGRLALGWGPQSPLSVWSTETGRTLQAFEAGRGALFARFDADGRRVLACDAAGAVRAWRVDGGAPTLLGGAATTPAAHDDCQLGPDGTTRALLGTDGRGTLLTPRAPGGIDLGPTRALRLSPDGRWLLQDPAADGAPTVTWDTEAGLVTPSAVEATTNTGGPRRASIAIAWAGDTKVLLREDGGQALLVVTPRRGASTEIRLGDNAGGAQPTALAVSGDGRHAVVGDSAGGASLWNLATRQRVSRSVLHETGREIGLMRLSSDGSVLLSAAADGELRLARAWQTPAWREEGPLPTVPFVAISADGRVAAWVRGDGRVVRRPLDGASASVELEGLATRGVVELSDDGRELAQVEEGRVRWWPTPSSPAVEARFEGRSVRLAFDPGSPLLSVLTDGGRLYRWDASSTQTTPVLDRNVGGTVSVAVPARDGSLLALMPGPTVVRVGTDGSARPFTGTLGTVSRMVLSTSGRSLWVATLDAAGPSLQRFRIDAGIGEASTGPVPGVAALYDYDVDDQGADARLALVDSAGRLHLKQGTLDLGPLPESGRTNVKRVRWLPDGRLLVVHLDGVARLWTVPPAGGAAGVDAAAFELGGNAESFALSREGRRLLVATRPAVATGELDAATLALKRAVDREAQLRDIAAKTTAATPNAAPSKGGVSSIARQQQSVANALDGARTDVQRETDRVNALQAARAAAALPAVTAWALPDATPHAAQPAWSDGGSLPLPPPVSVLLAIAAAALAALAQRRLRTRLARRATPGIDRTDPAADAVAAA